jgi:Reverse transcriptase (RNA-dependent DNA polymerase)
MGTYQLKRKLITTKWIFKKKTEQDYTIRHKARVVSRGFMQITGVNYLESFAPVASDTSIRVIIAMFLYYHHRDNKSQIKFNAYLTYHKCIEIVTDKNNIAPKRQWLWIKLPTIW